MQYWIVTALAAGTAFLGVMGLVISPSDELRQADAIVAISGGNTEARVAHAIDLYDQDLAPVIVFSGAALDPLAPSNAEVMRRQALRAGVPAVDIRIEEEATNTQENAEESQDILQALGADTVLLVTSPYHQLRAGVEFADVLGSDIEIINAPAPDPEWSRGGWFFSPRGWFLTIGEIVRLPFAYL